MAAHRLRGCLPWPKLAQALRAFPCYNSLQIICIGSFATPSFLYSMPLRAHLRCASVYTVTIKSASCRTPSVALFNPLTYAPKFSARATILACCVSLQRLLNLWCNGNFSLSHLNNVSISLLYYVFIIGVIYADFDVCRIYIPRDYIGDSPWLNECGYCLGDINGQIIVIDFMVDGFNAVWWMSVDD